MSTDPHQAAEQVLRRAVSTNDLTLVEGLLAPDAQWHGAGPGGECRSRDDVVATFRKAREQGMRPELKAVRRHAERVLLEVALGTDPETDESPAGLWFVLTLDAAGEIVALRDYSTAGAAERDLAVWARARDAATARGRRSGRSSSSKVSGLVPFLDVADVGRSASFYGLLGLEVQGTHEEAGLLVWASLESDAARLMVARYAEPLDAAAQAVFFYLYVDDLATLRDDLVAHGLQPSEIVDGSPGPRKEMRMSDPDGYRLMVAQADGVATDSAARLPARATEPSGDPPWRHAPMRAAATDRR